MYYLTACKITAVSVTLTMLFIIRVENLLLNQSKNDLFSYVKPVPNALYFDITSAGPRTDKNLQEVYLSYCDMPSKISCCRIVEVHNYHWRITVAPLMTLNCHVLVSLHVYLNVGCKVRHCRPACVLSLFSAVLLSVYALPLPRILLFQIPLLLVQVFTFILYVDRLK